MDEDLDFTDDEIREELAKLGYYDIAGSRLEQFKHDLYRLVRHDRSKNSSQNSSVNSSDYIPRDEGLQSRPHLEMGRVPLEETALLSQQPSKSATSAYPHFVRGKENIYSDEEDREELLITHINRGRGNGDAISSGTKFIKIPQANDTMSETDSERRYIRRKTLRKGHDGSKTIDESVTESEVGSLADLEERLKEVRMADHMFRGERETRRPASAPPIDAPYRLEPDDPRPASVILRTAEHPHTRNVKKCDPVSRYHQFRQSWQTNRVPGEKLHKQLRWNVREQMLCQDTMEYKRPQKTYIPNKYVVPTAKKRSALRWQVRMDMAQGNVPVTDLPEDF